MPGEGGSGGERGQKNVKKVRISRGVRAIYRTGWEYGGVRLLFIVNRLLFTSIW